MQAISQSVEPKLVLLVREETNRLCLWSLVVALACFVLVFCGLMYLDGVYCHFELLVFICTYAQSPLSRFGEVI